MPVCPKGCDVPALGYISSNLSSVWLTETALYVYPVSTFNCNVPNLRQMNVLRLGQLFNHFEVSTSTMHRHDKKGRFVVMKKRTRAVVQWRRHCQYMDTPRSRAWLRLFKHRRFEQMAFCPFSLLKAGVSVSRSSPGRDENSKVPCSVPGVQYSLKIPRQMKIVVLGGKLSKSVNWCFELSRSLWIISGLKETFIKRYMVESANKA